MSSNVKPLIMNCECVDLVVQCFNLNFCKKLSEDLKDKNKR